jgi:peptide deformylase
MPETKSKIKTLGDPVLRRKAKPVEKITQEHSEILSQMAKAMHEGDGIGLAAPQIGISLQMIVIDVGGGLYKLINPKIVKREGFQAITEGCLSVPGVSVKVKRSKKVWVEAKDENNKPLEVEANDLFACAVQHEIDHLNGKLIIDYATFLEKIRIKRKLAALKTDAKASGKLQL